MANYIGIDLGTTNSAISSFDGEQVRLFKSPEQNDVTSSAIFIDKRGNKYIGKRAYDNAARAPENAATLFKRFMGTSTPIKLPAVNLTMTPEECSAEILRVLFGYLPEEIRNNPETGTVITVPAAFNQMQKDATMSAAEMAGLGNVALMQEPVAAVMSVMRTRKSDGIFLVFDLGGGTLDIAIAQSTNGRVSLLSHGGIAMCGGRDFDRKLFDNVVKPWLTSNFDLAEDFINDVRFQTLKYMATWATEKAKIELSGSEESVITLDDTELRIKDNSGKDIYLDIPITRDLFNDLIEEEIEQGITAAREAIEKAGLSSHDIGRVVFVGGPTQYKPLRDKVAFELGIAASTDVNPMTAVAEGAALFAESIEWSSSNRGRKSGRGTLATGGKLDIAFNYQSRTPGTRAKVVAKIGGSAASGSAFQIDSIDTGWSSGKVALVDGAVAELPLSKPGDNIFKIFVFDAAGGPISLAVNRIVIARTAAQIDAIPASHSVGIEALEKLGGRIVLDYLVREGDQLPKKGKKSFKAAEALRAGSAGSLKFKVWEGDITDPVHDNRFIGIFEIRGTDIDEGVITKGADIICDYEINDSGNIVLAVTIPSIAGTFKSSRNFYSRQEGQIDYSDAVRRIEEETESVRSRLEELEEEVSDPKLDAASERLESAKKESNSALSDPEAAKRAMDAIQEARRLIAQARKENLKVIRELELERVINFFESAVKEHARPAEVNAYENLTKTAKRAIENNSGDFESIVEDMRTKNFLILWRQDWFVIDRFNRFANSPHIFPNTAEYRELCIVGQNALSQNDIDKLRDVVGELDSIRISNAGDDDMAASTNILVG